MATHDYIVNVPPALAAAVHGHALHLRVDDSAALLEAADTLPWRRIREVTLPALDDYASMKKHHGRARWNLRWEGFDVGRLLDLVPALRRRTVTVLVAPDDRVLCDKLALGESLSLQMAVPLTDPDALDPATLGNIISYVLSTSPMRRVRIEPVASMMATALGHEDLTLWDFAEENVRRNLFVDDAGRVSPSARHAETHPYGPLHELDPEALVRGPSYQRLLGYAEGLFVSRSECATCRAYPLCGGWLRYVDQGYDCQPWQRVLNTLQDAVGKTERDRILKLTPAGGS